MNNTHHPMQVTVACHQGVDVHKLARALQSYPGVTSIQIGRGIGTDGIPEGTVVIEVASSVAVSPAR